MSWMRIMGSDDWVVDYDRERGMYRVSNFEDFHYRDECIFDAYEEKEVLWNVYNRKYKLIRIETMKHNDIHDFIKNKVCYLAYLNPGERGWFLCDTEDFYNPVHRVHTSIIKSVDFDGPHVVVKTENTEYTFELIFRRGKCMKNKLLTLALFVSIAIGLSGCKSNILNINKVIDSPNHKLADFEIVEANFYGVVLVDKNTNVMYYWITANSGIIIPIYNSDGSLKIYEED